MAHVEATRTDAARPRWTISRCALAAWLVLFIAASCGPTHTSCADGIGCVPSNAGADSVGHGGSDGGAGGTASEPVGGVAGNVSGEPDAGKSSD